MTGVIKLSLVINFLMSNLRSVFSMLKPTQRQFI